MNTVLLERPTDAHPLHADELGMPKGYTAEYLKEALAKGECFESLGLSVHSIRFSDVSSVDFDEDGWYWEKGTLMRRLGGVVFRDYIMLDGNHYYRPNEGGTTPGLIVRLT